MYLRLLQCPEYLNTGAANDSVYQQIFQSMPSDNPGRVALFNSNMLKGEDPASLLANYSFTPLNTYETNFAAVHDVYMRNWSKGQYYLSPSDSSTLYSIALLDPASEGEAVFMARDMLRLLVWGGNVMSPRIQEDDGLNQNINRIEVFPNPSDGHLTIRMNSQEIGIGTFRLYDLTGRLQAERTLKDAREQSIDLGELKPGIYLYSIHTNFGIMQSGKLIINR